MKMAITFNHTLIVDISEQANLLQLLTSAKAYKKEGWSDCTYTQVDETPEIVFVKDSQIIDSDERVKQLEEEARKRSNDLWKAQQETSDVQKQLRQLQDKFEALESIVQGEPIQIGE